MVVGGLVFDSSGDEHRISSKETLAANGEELKNNILEIIRDSDVS